MFTRARILTFSFNWSHLIPAHILHTRLQKELQNTLSMNHDFIFDNVIPCPWQWVLTDSKDGTFISLFALNFESFWHRKSPTSQRIWNQDFSTSSQHSSQLLPSLVILVKHKPKWSQLSNSSRVPVYPVYRMQTNGSIISSNCLLSCEAHQCPNWVNLFDEPVALIWWEERGSWSTSRNKPKIKKNLIF